MLRSAALTTLLVAALAAPASATTFSGVDGRLHVQAAAGEKNAISISPLDTGPVIVRDDGANATKSGCPEWTPPFGDVAGDLVCSAVRAPVIDLGDQDDSVSVSDAGTEDLIGETIVDGGPGNDTITTAYSSDVLRGGEGNDKIVSGDLGDDRLEGGAGNDTLEARWGKDTIVGGSGTDTVYAGEDDDTIDVADGTQDYVDCGGGTDTVKADQADTLGAGCEKVTRVGGGGGGAKPTGQTQRPTTQQQGAAPATRLGQPAPVVAPPVAPRATIAPRDTKAPRLSVKRTGRMLTLRCDEACTVTIKAGARTLTKRLARSKPAKIRIRGRARTAKLTVRDAAGNRATTSRRLA